VIALTDYPIGRAYAGGSRRIRQVLGTLSADVILITYGARNEARLLQPGFLVICLEKSRYHQAPEQAVNHDFPVSANDIVAALFAPLDHRLAILLAELEPRCATVIFEHCYMAPALDFLRAQLPDLPVVYDANNVEIRIKADLLGRHPYRLPLLRWVADIERRLVRSADRVVACTAEDAAYFTRSGATVLRVGNVCSPPCTNGPAPDALADGPVRAGFLGSSHPPNTEAACWIIEHLAGPCPDIVFEFVGGVCDSLRDAAPLPANVSLHGELDEAAKSRMLGTWTIALNPLAGGGGSSLKLPDYMVHGLPSLSTPYGARGFPVAARQLGEVAERYDLPRALRRLIGDAPRLLFRERRHLCARPSRLDQHGCPAGLMARPGRTGTRGVAGAPARIVAGRDLPLYRADARRRGGVSGGDSPLAAAAFRAARSGRSRCCRPAQQPPPFRLRLHAGPCRVQGDRRSLRQCRALSAHGSRRRPCVRHRLAAGAGAHAR
jgi:hypothetical protein